MRSNVLQTGVLFSVAMLAAVACAPANAGVVFSDSQFDLPNYTATAYSSGAVATTITQTANGNPGSALQTSWTATGAFDLANGVLRSSFFYNPAISGAIASIDASIDRIGSRTINGAPVPFSTYSWRPLIFQNGNFYQAVSLPVNAISGGVNVWVTLQLNSLTAADFGLYDFSTGVLNSAINPDFNAGMTFGFISAFSSGASGVTVAETRNDNWIVRVNTVSEPSSLITGLCLVVALCFGGRTRFSAGRRSG